MIWIQGGGAEPDFGVGILPLRVKSVLPKVALHNVLQRE